MVGPAWEAFATELARWKDAGRLVDFWWRDDDAGRPVPALSRLLELAARTRVPLALAVIPEIAEREVFAEIDSEVAVIQHGVDHGNRAAAAEKKSEFPCTESVESALQRLATGRRKLESVAGPLAIPVLAPPWNRISKRLVPHLGTAGYRGLSAFGVRKVTNPAPDLTSVNTHADIIDWRGSRGFCGIEQALGQAVRHLEARRTGRADPQEPTGWLTHHAVHDEQCWAFLEDLFDATRIAGGVRWRSPAEMFSSRSAT